MKQVCLPKVVACFISLVALQSSASWAASTNKVASHIPNWVADAAKVGVADNKQVVQLTAFMGLRSEGELRQLILAQTTPGSAEYGHFLTAEEFHARFTPSAEDAAKVEQSLSSLGFKVGKRSASNLFVQFTGTVSQIKSIFHVTQNLYMFDGKTMRSNAEEIVLPSSLRGLVTAISGLDDTGQLIHPFHRTIDDAEVAKVRANFAKTSEGEHPFIGLPPSANLPSPYCSNYYGDTTATLSKKPSPYAASVPWLVCAYTPQQIRLAYGADKTKLDGKGVTVAIVDAYTSPTLVYDANRYSQNHGLPMLTSGGNFQEIYNGNLSKVSANDACQPQGWFGEISLDVDAVHTMAPGANILYSGALSCSNADLDGALYTVIDGTATVGGPLADIVSNSYGETGEQSSEAEQAVDTAIFEQAAAEGVSVLFSSGDDGDVALLTGYSNGSWPATSPYVTGVGGTSLALRDAAGTKDEWGWGTFRANLTGATVESATMVKDTGYDSFTFYSGAGGGPSFYWAEPSYQQGIVPAVLTEATYDLKGNKYPLPDVRVTPDVSMDADPYTGFLIGESYTITGDPVSDSGCTPYAAKTEYCESGIGGTSLASPLFAGTLALVDEQRQANGLGDLGMANPYLYGQKVGIAGSKRAAIIDVLAPASPTSMLRGYQGNPNRIRLISVNSTPGPFGPLCTTTFCKGQDSWALQTKKGYDNVTGLGTPNIPALITALSK